MARTKSPPIRREPSDIKLETNGTLRARGANGRGDVSKILDRTIAEDKATTALEKVSEPGVLNLVASVGFIYIFFIGWGFLQERITTTTYGPSAQRWSYPLVLNTVQSILASIVGYIYLSLTTSHPHKPGKTAPIFPSAAIVRPLLLVSITSSLASPFGYASLKHIDYITFLLAKSCKLLPVMFLHITLFGKRYPFYKYAVVALVTLGVALFTLQAEGAKAAKHKSKRAKSADETNQIYGLFLLSINLLFDGLTNTVQDDVFLRFKPYSSPQMMCALNIMSTLLTSTYLLISPYIAPTFLGSYLGLSPTTSELTSALAFAKQYPQVGLDVVYFGLCGALGQVAIYHTLSTFGSLILVTVTVTRKMLTMALSVVWFGHSITPMQWAGIGLVFGGVGGEAAMSRREKLEKQRKEKARRMSEAGKDRVKKGL